MANDVLPQCRNGDKVVPQLNLRKVEALTKSSSRPFPKQVTFSYVDTYPIEWRNKGVPVSRVGTARYTESDYLHGTRLDS